MACPATRTWMPSSGSCPCQVGASWPCRKWTLELVAPQAWEHPPDLAQMPAARPVLRIQPPVHHRHPRGRSLAKSARRTSCCRSTHGPSPSSHSTQPARYSSRAGRTSSSLHGAAQKASTSGGTKAIGALCGLVLLALMASSSSRAVQTALCSCGMQPRHGSLQRCRCQALCVAWSGPRAPVLHRYASGASLRAATASRAGQQRWLCWTSTAWCLGGKAATKRVGSSRSRSPPYPAVPRRWPGLEPMVHTSAPCMPAVRSSSGMQALGQCWVALRHTRAQSRRWPSRRTAV
mmetsp:Transcript_48622/g.155306  ORF Transcript_48622/g.155306 Transcript_48622/m.155306 type:complete len:291 (+) Transcript_48622:642-1514(+)